MTINDKTAVQLGNDLVTGKIVICLVCESPSVYVFPHRTKTGNIAGLIFLCAKHANTYAAGEFKLTPIYTNGECNSESPESEAA